MNNRHFLALIISIFAVFTSHASEDHDHAEETNHESAEVSPEKGIKLSDAAVKSFGIKTIAYTSGPLKLPRSAIFFGAQEKNLYRVRDGSYQRIDFETRSKTKSDYTVVSTELKSGDLVVIDGLGFLRIAEIAATGGAVHGHSH